MLNAIQELARRDINDNNSRSNDILIGLVIHTSYYYFTVDLNRAVLGTSFAKNEFTSWRPFFPIQGKIT